MKRISVEAECNGTTMEELIPEIVLELKRRAKESRSFLVYKEVIKEAEGLKDNYEGDEAQRVFDKLIQAMDDVAPPYFWFGPVEGGYNYHLDRSGLEDVPSYENEPPKGFHGEWVHINDHGNTSLYYRNLKGIDSEMWAIV